jgi:hypothetical protein
MLSADELYIGARVLSCPQRRYMPLKTAIKKNSQNKLPLLEICSYTSKSDDDAG